MKKREIIEQEAVGDNQILVVTEHQMMFVTSSPIEIIDCTPNCCLIPRGLWIFLWAESKHLEDDDETTTLNSFGYNAAF